jgi:hypothetical protein
MLDGSRLTLSFHLAQGSFLRGVRGLQVAPQAHVESNRNTHYDQRTDTQNQEPPDHPHSRLG